MTAPALPRAIQIRIPLSMLRASSPNAAPAHWSGRQKARKALRQAAALLIRAQVGRDVPRFARAELSAVAFGQRRWDDDNLAAALKSVRDAFQDVGVVANDSAITMGVVSTWSWAGWERAGGKRPWPGVPEIHDHVLVTLREAGD